MKLGYGNYGMKGVALADLAGGLARLGYEAFEVCVMDGWPSHPDNIDADERRRLRKSLADASLEFTAALGGYKVLVPSDDLPAQVEAFRAACRLLHELTDKPTPVITSTLGGGGPTDWDTGKRFVGDRCVLFADAALEEECCFAVEAHIGGILDVPDRVAWLLTQYQHPALRANFDISHFLANGCDMATSIALVAPYGVHAHVKDSTLIDGKVRFLLPGEGTTDYAKYFQLLGEAGWKLPVTVEVSQQVFTRAGYKPWEAAAFCFTVLDKARHEAGARSVG